MLKRGLWTREYVSQILSSRTISIFLVTHHSGKSQENSYKCHPWRKPARFSPCCTLLPRYGMATKTSSSSTKTRPVLCHCRKWEVWELEHSLTWQWPCLENLVPVEGALTTPKVQVIIMDVAANHYHAETRNCQDIPKLRQWCLRAFCYIPASVCRQTRHCLGSLHGRHLEDGDSQQEREGSS